MFANTTHQLARLLLLMEDEPIHCPQPSLNFGGRNTFVINHSMSSRFLSDPPYDDGVKIDLHIAMPTRDKTEIIIAKIKTAIPMQTEKLAMFDLDGTLTVPESGEEFPKHAHDYALRVEAIKEMIQLHQLGWKCVIVSNKGGVESGYQTNDQVLDAMKFIIGKITDLFNDDSFFLGAYWAPTFDGTNCCSYYVGGDTYACHTGSNDTFRKPSPGMLQLAISTFKPVTTKFFGNFETDRQAAEAAGVEYVDLA